MKPLLFIADLHLDPSVPATLQRFRQFCRRQAGQAAALYILGDLFEAWIGDDADDHAATTARKSLADLSSSGTEILIMQGNRDFLLGQRFVADCGAKLLPDPSVITWQDQRIALCHGDSLCTADADYQALRERLRSPEVQAALLAQTRSERQTLARKAREASQQAGAEGLDPITDVTEAAVDGLLDELDADVMIHGHTHRPGDHRWLHRGRQRRRLVVGSWAAGADYVVAESASLALRRSF